MTKVPLDEFADKLNLLLPQMFKEFTRRQQNELYKGKITLPQFVLLDFLWRNGPAKMTELARTMSVTTAAMTGIITRLVRDNYACRNYDLKDRRIIRIGITQRGENLVKKINLNRREMIIDIFGRISEAERRDYLRILEHICDILISS